MIPVFISLYILSINPWQWANLNLTRLNQCETAPVRRMKQVTVKNRREEDLCTNWEEQQERKCLCCQEIDEAVNRISGEYFLFKR